MRCLLAWKDGTQWIGSEGSGLCRWRNGTLRKWTRDDGLPSDKIFALCADGHGGLWIGSQGGRTEPPGCFGPSGGGGLPHALRQPGIPILEDGRKGNVAQRQPGL